MAPRGKAKATKAEEPKATKATKATTKATSSKPAATKRAASEKPATNGAPSRKRKAEIEEEYSFEVKKPKTEKAEQKKAATPAPEPVDPRPKVAIGRNINTAPTTILDVYVFGEGTSGELGLGSKKVNNKKPIDVKRPRLNENLSAKSVGVVQVSCGGMHVIALTRDNKLLTWGVNDQGALGRDTAWDGGLKDMDAAEDSDSDSDDDDDTGMNPMESNPAPVSDEFFAKDTVFVQVIACDSASFALTQDGRVYGWGTFRSSDGILGFTENIKIQTRPMLLPSLKQITKLAHGANHILALDTKGNVHAWGCGQQNQLGRRIIERNKLSSLIPQGVGLPRGRIVDIACGSYHSFAIDRDGKVWGWGLNNFGEVGVEGNAGEDDAVILRPQKVTFLEKHNIASIEGGGHHSVACNDNGELITWGRIDGSQVGHDMSIFTKENAIFDERDTPRILFVPTVVPGKSFISQTGFTSLTSLGMSKVVNVAAGFDNSFAVTSDGKAYSWGFSSNYQTGQGGLEDVEKPTLIDNTAIREKEIIAAGAGGQYSILLGKAEDQSSAPKPKVNGC